MALAIQLPLSKRHGEEYRGSSKNKVSSPQKCQFLEGGCLPAKAVGITRAEAAGPQIETVDVDNIGAKAY